MSGERSSFLNGISDKTGSVRILMHVLKVCERRTSVLKDQISRIIWQILTKILFCFSGGLLRELSGFSKKDGKIDGEIEFNGETNGVECTKATKIVD